VGKLSFLLQDRLVDEGFISAPVVSGKFSTTAEVWVLTRAKYERLSAGLQRALQDMATIQLAAEREHTLLSGE